MQLTLIVTILDTLLGCLSSSSQTNEECIVTPFLQTRKLWFKRIESLAQDREAGRCQAWDVNIWTQTPESSSGAGCCLPTRQPHEAQASAPWASLTPWHPEKVQPPMVVVSRAPCMALQTHRYLKKPSHQTPIRGTKQALGFQKSKSALPQQGSPE